MAAAPSVTVLLAVYNGERFVEEAIRSVLAQTHDAFEFIIVDDGSTDRTPAIVSALPDDRIRVLRNDTNLGLTVSLNRGLAEARGEFLARLDADDIAEPTRLARQIRFLRENRAVAMVGSGCRIIDERGRVLRKESQPENHDVLRWVMAFLCPFYHSAVTWRRSLVADRVGAYDESFRYAMDYDLWVRIADRLPVANLPSPLVRYRMGPFAMSSTHPDRFTELRRARFNAAHALFPEGSNERALWDNQADRILQIIDGWQPETGPDEVDWVATTIESLSESYIAGAAVPSVVADAIRKWTRHWLSRQLLKGAMDAHRIGATARRDASFRTAVSLRPASLASFVAARYARARLGLA